MDNGSIRRECACRCTGCDMMLGSPRDCRKIIFIGVNVIEDNVLCFCSWASFRSPKKCQSLGAGTRCVRGETCLGSSAGYSLLQRPKDSFIVVCR